MSLGNVILADEAREKQTRCANTMRSLGDIKMLRNSGRKWVTDFLQMWNCLGIVKDVRLWNGSSLLRERIV
jgi:hypothetical protein